MTNTKWLRSVLLGGVAVSVMATGAQASELSDLKAQLEALQSRVNTIETAPAANLPAGAMLMTMSKGRGSNNWADVSARDAANVASDRGFTIAINPTADLPAPVTEITIFGYAKLDASWNSKSGGGQTFFMPGLFAGAPKASSWNLHARQSRFGIDAKTDTAIGQVRSRISGDFYGSAPADFRMRHAYGEWDMTDTWTLVAGQTWHTASLLPLGVSTIDFSGTAGPSYSRSAQLSLKYGSGPIKALIGISHPIAGTAADYPDLGGYMTYTAGGGHQIFASASIGDDDSGVTNSTSWQVGGGANIRLGDLASITAGALYGKGGQARRYLNQEAFGAKNAVGNPTKMWGALVGVSMNVSEATTVNAQFGYSDNLESAATTVTNVDDTMTIYANILWRPVKQMRLGWEVEWGRNDYFVGASNSMISGRFGAWFFF